MITLKRCDAECLEHLKSNPNVSIERVRTDEPRKWLDLFIRYEEDRKIYGGPVSRKITDRLLADGLVKVVAIQKRAKCGNEGDKKRYTLEFIKPC